MNERAPRHALLSEEELGRLLRGEGGPARESAEQVASYFDRLWPLMRSLAGEGVRESHKILSEILPLERIEIPSGTVCFDWTVPKEWVVREAYVVAPGGERILDVADHTLHLLNYAHPFHGRLTRAELDAHLYSLPEQPDAIPYVTSYYEPRWGFCLTDRQRRALPEGEYQVVVDTELVDGSMTIAECVLAGESAEEVLISTNTCHPSMANNELSGPLVAAFLGRRLQGLKRRRLTYRFVFLPETIGSIAYLSLRGEHLKARMVAGYHVVCVGTDAPFTYKKSRRGDSQGGSLADRAARAVLGGTEEGGVRTLDFRADWGSDERQYCSPGFDLPLGSVMRSVYGEYPEYHTSLDDRDFISFEAMVGSVDACFDICRALDMNRTYINRRPHGELQLGKRGLFPTLGNFQENWDQVSAMLWLLNLADGTRDLLAIAARSGVDIRLLDHYARLFREMDILEVAPSGGGSE